MAANADDGLPVAATATAAAATTTTTTAAATPQTTPQKTSHLPLLGSPAPQDSCGNGGGDGDAAGGAHQHHRQQQQQQQQQRRPPPATPPPPPPPPHNAYWEHSRPLRARVAADDGTRLYYEVHGLSEARRKALQRRAGPVPRPPCWSAAGYFAQSSGGAREDAEGEESFGPSTTGDPTALDDPEDKDPRPRVLLIMGLACGASAWRWTVPDLVSPLELPLGNPAPMVVAALDNRGCGSSDAPRERERYSTEIMAADARRVLEDLGWWPRRQQGAPPPSPPSPSPSPSPSPPPYSSPSLSSPRARPVHIVGFSMGGMIAMKLAASVASNPDPHRHAVASLTVLSASGGGFETIPWRSLRGLRTAACIALARSPEAAAEATLGMHFARRTLRAPVPHHSPTPPGRGGGRGDDGDEREEDDEARRAAELERHPPPQPAALVAVAPMTRRFELLRREYLVRSSSSQPAHGFSGQLRACWRHRFTGDEARCVRRAHFPLLVLHGRRDPLAAPALGERLARRLRCPSVHLEGAHFIVRECAAQVNALLVAVALAEGGGGGGTTGGVAAGTGGGAGEGVAAASAAAAASSYHLARAGGGVGSPPPGLPRFARAPREAQATWHLDPSPVVQAMWSDKNGKGAEAKREGGVRRRRGKAGADDDDGGIGAPRVTARAL